MCGIFSIFALKIAYIMADNYLERKMEELHSVKASTAPTRRYTVQRTQLCYPYKTLRVLIVAAGRKYIRQYADVFRNHEGRVAVFNTVPENETDLGENHGCRYYNMSDICIGKAFDSLFKAWRDIDVVVILDAVTNLQTFLCRHVMSLPYPNEWGMPVLEVGDKAVIRHRDLNFTLQDIYSEDMAGNPAAGQLPYLALPQNRCVSRLILQH